MYTIFTDGASARNGQVDQVGGWGYVILDEKENIIHQAYGGKKGATNNWGELTAAVKAMEYIMENLYDKKKVFFDPQFIIYSDSSYLINCYSQGWYINWMTNGWKTASKTPVANRTLWEKLIPTFDNIAFLYKKVRGHNTGDTFLSRWNNYADKLAVAGRTNAEHASETEVQQG